MVYLAILSAVFLFTIQTICFKEFNRSFMKNLSSYFIFNFMYFTIVVIIFWIARANAEGFDPSTIMLGVVFGILFVCTILLYMKAMETGPLSYTALAFSFGLLVPIIFGVSFWSEKISIVQSGGLILLFTAFYLGSKTSRDEKQRKNLRWVLLCVVALIGNGGLMTITKFHQILLPGRQIKEFLILSFGTASLLSLILFLWRYFVKNEKVVHLKNLNFLFIALGAGITTAFGNQLMLYLAGKVPGVILFPTVNGSIVFFSSIFSIFLYREKLTRNGVLGLVSGVTALVLLSLS